MSVIDLARYDMRRVNDVAALCGLLHRRRDDAAGTVLLAGGTDFLVEVSQGPRRDDPLPLVVDISTLEELHTIDWDGTSMRIGAGVSYLSLQRHPAVRRFAPALARMASDVGGPTIQARGTLGGNLATASPAADGVAAIAAYDAAVEVRSVRGVRRIPFAEYQTGYKQSTRAVDEVIVAITFRPPAEGSPWLWRKVAARRAQAISKVALAAVAELSGGRVTRFGAALASVAAVTARLPNTRKLVTGASLAEVSEEALNAAVASDISPIDDVRSTRAYRLHCAQALVRGFVRQLRGDAGRRS